MSYRVEEKIPLTEYDSYAILHNIKNLGFKALYSERKIKSIYLDNNCHQAFYDSEEGVLPRKKIRLRTYPNTKKTCNLEIKTSSIEGRFKTTKEISGENKTDILNYGYIDNLYGILMPVCLVEYKRLYFFKDNIRLTFDRNIIYKKSNYENIPFNDRRCVIEIKTTADQDLDFLRRLLPDPRARFSKFCEAIKFLSIC